MAASHATDSTADRRVAMVIGNAAYCFGPKLANPIADAEAIAAAFERLGFESVARSFDLDKAAQDVALKRFTIEAKAADMAVIYYAGHGMEMDGENYLLPVDVELSDVSSLGFEATRLSDVMRAVEGARKFRFVILDACRDNPFRGRMQGLDATRSIASRGLAAVEPPGNTLVAYAARHGTTAKDGAKGQNSPYASALLERIETPNLDIRLVLGHVRDDVMAATGNQQQPFFYGTLGGAEIQLKRVAAAPAPAAPGEHAELLRALEEERDWERAQRANDVAAYRAFADKWPSGRFTSQVADKIAEKLLVDERADWSAAKTADAVDAYVKFRMKWPDGQYAGKVDAKISAALEREEGAAHKRALSTDQYSSPLYNKPGPLNEYLAKFPDHANAAGIRDRLKKMEDDYAARFERDALKSGAEAYIKLFPDGGRVDAALDFIDVAGDDRHWIKVLNTAESLVDSSDKVTAIKAYLKDWPEGRHVDQANRLLETLGAREKKVAIAGGLVGLAMLCGFGFLVISFALWAVPQLWTYAPKSVVELRTWIADAIKPADAPPLTIPLGRNPADYKPLTEAPRMKTLEEHFRERKALEDALTPPSTGPTATGLGDAAKRRYGLDALRTPDGASAAPPPNASALGMESETGPLMDVPPQRAAPQPTN